MRKSRPHGPGKPLRLDEKLYASAGRVYAMTIRAQAGRRPFVLDGLNQETIQLLAAMSENLRCSVFTYCLTPDHLHFLVSPKEHGISVLTFVDRFKGKTTNASWKHGRQGRLWQPRYHDHIVRSGEDLKALAEYMLDNPVRAGLADAPEGWPWSGQINPLPL